MSFLFQSGVENNEHAPCTERKPHKFLASKLVISPTSFLVQKLVPALSESHLYQSKFKYFKETWFGQKPGGSSWWFFLRGRFGLWNVIFFNKVQIHFPDIFPVFERILNEIRNVGIGIIKNDSISVELNGSTGINEEIEILLF